MHQLESFLIFCSGADQQVLKRTPTEKNRLVGIGACVLFTGLFAFAAASYALHTVFNSIFISLIAGLLWGLMIFNLDRYIVSTIRKKDKFFRDSFSILPRLALAVLIAVVIAKPLELKVFETEIDAELAIMEQESKVQREQLVRSRYEQELTALNESNEILRGDLLRKEELRDEAAREALLEADGTGGSMRRNMGPIYAIKKAEADKLNDEFLQLQNANQSQIESNQSRIAEINDMMEAEIVGIGEIAQTGLASRIQALSRLSSRNPAIFYAGLFIMLLFIAIETAPIIVKLMNKRSPYDFVLDKHEYAFEMNHKRINTLLQNDTQNTIDYELETSKHRTGILIEAENKIMEEALKSELEKVDPRSVKWRGILKRSGLFLPES